MGARTWLAAVFASLALGCVSRLATTESYTHSANVLPPGGPSIAGTPLRPRSVAVEVSGAYHANNTGDAPRRPDGLAHRNADVQGSARLLIRVGALEIGPSVDWSFGPTTPASPDDDAPPRDLAFRAGLAARVHLVQRPRWTVGLNLEAAFMHVPLRTVRTGSSDVSAIGSCDDPRAIAYYGSSARCLGAWGASGPLGSAPAGGGAARESAREHLELRAGLFGAGSVARNVWLLGGLLGQLHPRIRGFEPVVMTCARGLFGSCGPSSEAQSAEGAALVGTFWFGVGVDLGAVSLSALVHANALGPSEITARAPVGFSLNTRFNVGL